MDKKVKHLEFIQGIISRMAKNSFMLKGWAVTLVVGIFALTIKDSDRLFWLIAYAPILIFWGLDAYYLSLERQYRDLYNQVRIKDENNIDFNLKLNHKNAFKNWLCCVISKTEIVFYLPIALFSTGVALLIYFL